MESAVNPTQATPHTLGRTLTAPRIAMLVVAVAAPLGSMIGNVPIGIILGNGAGLPVMFIVAALVVLCLATGYLAMSARVDRPGGFAALVGVSLGPAWGLGAAFATGLAYLAGTVALAVGTGYFTNLVLSGFGIVLPWWAWSAVALVLVFSLGRRGASTSAKALVVLMIAEFAILLALDVAILLNHGLDALPLESFSPNAIFSGSIGPALMIAFYSFVGVESAVLYTREAKNPGTTIPRGTFVAVSVTAVFYIVTSWMIIGSVGPQHLLATATETQGDLVFVVAASNAGDLVLALMQIFFCTSLLACLLALHSATVRYLQSLAQQRTLPPVIARVHPRHRAPSTASDVVVVMVAIVLAVSAFTGADPYLSIGTTLTGLFTIGAVGIQAVVAAAVIVYFRRVGSPLAWRTFWAPLIGGIGVVTVIILIVINYPVLTGSDSAIANGLPLLLPVALVAGAIVARNRARRGEPIDFESFSE